MKERVDDTSVDKRRTAVNALYADESLISCNEALHKIYIQVHMFSINYWQHLLEICITNNTGLQGESLGNKSSKI